MPINARIVMPIAAVLLTGCGLHSDDGGQLTASRGVLGALRPGADPALVQRLNQEERMRAQAQQQQQQQNNGQFNDQGSFLNGLGRALPRVSQDPIAPPAEQVAENGTTDNSEEGAAVVESANASHEQVTNPAVATYGASYYGGGVPPPPPGALGVGLVPPPVPVTLSTQAQTYTGGEGNYNPYANPYFNPYGIPVPQQAAAQQERPAGLFGNGRPNNAGNDDGDSSAQGRKEVAFIPITHCGMESRSQFKQRDDLRVLWKGAITQSSYLGALANEPKFLAQLNRVQVGLPSESTKGNFSVSSRQLDSIFKGNGIDKHVLPAVRRIQTELLQSYYRYIYTYNKFCFAQQTTAARKQEVNLASSPAEQQRATADLSQAQNEVEAAKDDMRSAQVELAQASSPSAARAVIGKVSGVSPSLDSLIQAEARSNKSSSGKIAMFGSMFNPIGSFFKMGHSKPEERKEARSDGDSNFAAPESATASADLDNASEQPGKGKSKKKGKVADETPAHAKLKVVEADTMPDLMPAPKDEPKATIEAPKATVEAPGKQSSATHMLDLAGVSFTLKGVNVSPRKSVLTVAIKNAGSDAFNFSPDLISVAEGSRKLSDAATRADFDATSVQPNEEVKGTITIFGRPWSDKLTVCLSERGKAIQLRRQ